MSKAEEYRAKSKQFLAEAASAADPKRRADLEWLANSYRLLAEHADDDSRVVHLPKPPMSQQQQPQQQQQGKLEPDEPDE